MISVLYVSVTHVLDVFISSLFLPLLPTYLYFSKFMKKNMLSISTDLLWTLQCLLFCQETHT